MNNRENNILVTNDDLNVNIRSTRMPIIICMEVLDNATMRKFDIAIKRIENYILNHEELKNEVQFAKLFFGDICNAERELSDMSNSGQRETRAEIKQSDTPVLGKCLIEAIMQIKVMECKQETAQLSSYKPNIILFATGNYKEDDAMQRALSKIRSIKRSNEISIIPFIASSSNISEKGIELLYALSTVGEVYKFDKYGETDISRIFDVLCKSMEKMSASSSEAYNSLFEADPVEIEDFKFKKGGA